jgi:hypothetical protein
MNPGRRKELIPHTQHTTQHTAQNTKHNTDTENGVKMSMDIKIGYQPIFSFGFERSR